MTLRSILRWALPGLFAYLVFLCATFPAAYLVHWVKPDPHGLELSAVSGSAWSGQAGQLVFQGVPLGRISWDFDWRAPWTGRLGYHIRLKDRTLDLAGRADVGRDRRIMMHNLAGRIPLSRLDHWMPLPSNSVDGLLQLQLASLTIAKGFPIAATGEVRLSDANLHWPESAALGSYRMKLHTTKEIVGQIQDSSGPLALNAQVRLQPNGRYTVSGNVSARDKTSAAAKLLSYMGSPGPGGKYPLNFNGQL